MGLAAAMVVSGCLGGPGASWVAPADTDTWTVGPYRPGTHAHNDYEQPRPLRDALEHGFASVEVDVYLIDGAFLVAHDEDEVIEGRTLEAMYLEPLRALTERQDGHVYPPPSLPLQLLIDVKTEAGPSYPALEAVLAEYDELFTRWEGDTVVAGPLTAVVSGNRPYAELQAARVRRAALDGRIYDPRDGVPTTAMPIVSVNWDDTSDGPDRFEVARRMIEQVQAEGRTIRFWNTEDRPEAWAWLDGLGVDYIGTDDIPSLARFRDGGSGR